MNRKAVSRIMLTLLVISMLTLAFSIDSVESEPKTWTVDDDGPADFTKIQDAVGAATAEDTILVYPGTYNENVDVNKSLTIKSESGAEETIVQSANPDDPIFEVTADNVNISGFTIEGAIGGSIYYAAGIYLSNVDSSHISNNNALNNHVGISLFSSSNNNLANNSADSNNYYGIVLYLSSNNVLTGNNLSNNYHGISMEDSSNNTLINNRFESNGISIFGNELSDYNTHVIENNIINGKPIYYYRNTNGTKVPEDAGEVILANCSNMIIENINASFGSVGMEIAYTKDSTIVNSNVNSNRRSGIFLYHSNNNIITSNNANSNGWEGIWLDSESNNNTLTNNSASDNHLGIFLSHSANNNLIHLNNFIANYYNVDSHLSINSWNSQEEITYTYNGNTFTNYLGNYWSNYTGVDLFNGPYQNETGSDGIGDTPYIIDEYNQDNYPLMKPWNPIPGDVNGDRIVNIFDIGYISAHWYPGPPIGPLGYHPNADINNDGAVNIFDIDITSVNWGESW